MLENPGFQAPSLQLEYARLLAQSGPEGSIEARAVLRRAVAKFGAVPALVAAARKLGASLPIGRSLGLGPSSSSPSSSSPGAGGPGPAFGPGGPLAVDLVPAGSTWRYLDNGSNAGTAWRSPTFSDSKWKLGPAELGYGDKDEKTVVSFGSNAKLKYVTTYFRRSFQVTRSYASSTLHLLSDDGAVVYLNGTEVVRRNMPTGTIGFQRFATRAIGRPEEATFYSFGIDPKLLRIGANVLAVEIHQANRTSSDISFNLRLSGSLTGPTLSREPYLQIATQKSVVLRWATSGPIDSVVWLGTSPTTLSQYAKSSARVTEHEVLLTGLKPDTLYYYTIGFGGTQLLKPSTSLHFRSSPGRTTTKKTRVWVLGDSGTGTTNARNVRDAYVKYAGSTGAADLVLLLGDNAYNRGRKSEYEQKCFAIYSAVFRNTPVWPAMGNHEAYSSSSGSQTGPYYDLFTLPTKGEAGGLPSGTEAYYSFDRGDMHFVCLDSAGSDRSKTGAMLTWVKADLAASKARWNIAFWHHPPYSKGSHDSDTERGMIEMRTVFLPALEAAGIDLVLTGHSHGYERSYLLDRHYGSSKTLAASMLKDLGDGRSTGDGSYGKPSPGRAGHEGTVYVVAGSSGLISHGNYNHPAIFLGAPVLGSLVLDIQGSRLSASFLSDKGKILDSFEIEKGVKRSLMRDFPKLSTTIGGSQTLRMDAGNAQGAKPYLLLGSFGTSPGFRFGGQLVPLNPDPWFDLSLSFPNSSLFVNSFGILDKTGKATAAIRVPPAAFAALTGTRLWHAFVVLGSGPALRHVSNPVSLRLVR